MLLCSVSTSSPCIEDKSSARAKLNDLIQREKNLSRGTELKIKIMYRYLQRGFPCSKCRLTSVFVILFSPELMLLGFISLLLTVFQGSISHICIPPSLARHMLPCKMHDKSTSGSEHNLIYYNTINHRRLFSEEHGSSTKQCTHKV